VVLPCSCRLRQRQMRNMACALLLSHGVPMLQVGLGFVDSINQLSPLSRGKWEVVTWWRQG